MRGDKNILSELNRVLTGELTAADQYFVHSRMLEDWGYHRLYERLDHERLEELDHASRVIRRILFLEGTPDVATRAPLHIGTTVPEIFKNDLDYEIFIIQELKRVIAICEAAKDYETRELLVDLLRDSEEDHAHWLEKQLGLINKISLQNYLQSAMGETKNEGK